MRIQLPYRACPVLGGDVAMQIADRVLCLPCSAHLTSDQQDEVVAIVRAVLEGAGASRRGTESSGRERDSSGPARRAVSGRG